LGGRPDTGRAAMNHVFHRPPRDVLPTAVEGDRNYAVDAAITEAKA